VIFTVASGPMRSFYLRLRFPVSTVPWNIRSGFDLFKLIVDFSRALNIVSSVNSVAVLLGLLLSARLSGS